MMPERKKLRRTCCRLTIVLAIMLAVIGALVWSLDDHTLDWLKFHLSLWTIIALVLIINLVSFITFLLMYVAYRWIKYDLKPDDFGQN